MPYWDGLLQHMVNATRASFNTKLRLENSNSIRKNIYARSLQFEVVASV